MFIQQKKRKKNQRKEKKSKKKKKFEQVLWKRYMTTSNDYCIVTKYFMRESRA